MTQGQLMNLEDRRRAVEEAREQAAGELEELKARRRSLAPAAVAGDVVAKGELAGVDELISEAAERLELTEAALEELDRLEEEERQRREAAEYRAAEARRARAEEEAEAAMVRVDEAATELAGRMRQAVRAAEEAIVASGGTLPEDGRAPREVCDGLQERVVERLQGHLRRLREGDGELRAWLQAARTAIEQACEELAEVDPRRPFREEPLSPQEVEEHRGRWHELRGQVAAWQEQVVKAELDLGEISYEEYVAVLKGEPAGYNGRGA
ncbi:MAG: hypothetical protein M3N33_02010 [Actinomycetota bacterium]|nr:hypothetical protein [Actinomycetota bacterium]